MTVTTPALDPRTAALLVMDYQPAILASAPPAPLVIAGITTSGVVLSTLTDTAELGSLLRESRTDRA